MQKYFQKVLKHTTWEHNFLLLLSQAGEQLIFIATRYPKGHLVCSGANAIRKCSPKRDDHCLLL